MTILPSTSFSLIIPVYNGGKAFGECLRSVRELEPAVAEWIVDDGSTDGSADRARAAPDRRLVGVAPRNHAPARLVGQVPPPDGGKPVAQRKFNLERPLLKRFVSAPEAGQYAAAQNLGLPVQACCMTLLPLVQQRLSQTCKAGNREQFLTMCGLVIRVGLCLGVGIGTLCLLASDLGRLLFVERYAESGRIGQILLVEQGFRCLLWSSFTILAAQQERRRVSRLDLRATGPLLLMFVVVLVEGSRWGFREQPGELLVLCAGVSVVRSLVLGWLAFGHVRQAMPLPFPWLTLGRALLAGGVAGTLATRLPEHGWGVLGQLGVQLTIHAGLLWLLGESMKDRARVGLRWPWRKRGPNRAEREPELH